MAILQSSARTARDIAEILSERKTSGAVVVVDSPKLEAHLDAAGLQVVSTASKRSPLRKAARPVLCGDALPFAPRSFSAAIVASITGRDSPEQTLRECARVVRPGGTVVVIDRGAPASLSALALCSGLVDVCQQGKGRSMLTIGRSSEFPP